MKHLSTIFILTIMLMLIVGDQIYAQGHTDPPFLQVPSAETAITLDGELNETDWMRRFDHLYFHPDFTPGDVEYSVTSGVLVDPADGSYVDSSTTIVKILHYGMDLYISLNSNDKYVNKWGGSWEGDGLFMKIKDASGADKEFKLYFNAAGTDPDMVYEESQVGSGQGMGYKMAGTIVNDTSAVDSGYTAELIIHLTELGFTEEDTEIEVLINIFDPDKQTGNSGEEYTIGSYGKMWWGSEWGPEHRILILADPPLVNAVKTNETIELDGQLNEGFWYDAESVVIAKGSERSTGGYYMQWGDTLNAYTDQSEAIVKFVHNGTDLYIGVQSNDSSVCEWSAGWEADGLFLWMTFKDIVPGPGDRMEIKSMYFGNVEGDTAKFEMNGNVPTGGAEGKSYEPAGTVTHTEVGGPDAGYSMEVVVHADLFGYSDGDTVMLSAVIWDLDYASADAFDQHVSDYAPHWWGAQWVDPNFEKYFMYRAVVLSDISTSIEVSEDLSIAKTYRLEQNYPNPFNPQTTITYSLPEKSRVKIEIFDVLGKRVSTLFDADQVAGEHNLIWNGVDQFEKAVSSGIYFYQLRTDNFSQTKKMILMR